MQSKEASQQGQAAKESALADAARDDYFPATFPFLLFARGSRCASASPLAGVGLRVSTFALPIHEQEPAEVPEVLDGKGASPSAIRVAHSLAGLPDAGAGEVPSLLLQILRQLAAALRFKNLQRPGNARKGG